MLTKICPGKPLNFSIMSKETYSIPVSPTACYDYQNNAITYCAANAVAWGIPDATISNLQAKSADYEKNFTIANNRNTQSPAATAASETFVSRSV